MLFSSSEGHEEVTGVISIGNDRKYSFKYIQISNDILKTL